MKIFLMPSAFAPSLGGVEEASRQLALHLQARGHEVTVATQRWPRDLPPRETIEGIEVLREAFRTPDTNTKAALTYALTQGGAQKRLEAAIRERGAQVIHVNCISAQALYAVRAAKNLKLPLVVTLQGELNMDAQGIFQHSQYARDLMTSSLQNAASITACSKQTLTEAEAFFGQPFGARGQVVYNGVNVADFGGVIPNQHAKPYFFALGRFVPQKGFDVLIEAFAKIASRVEHDFLLAGAGPETEPLEKLVNALNLSDRVHFVGRAERSQVASFMQGAQAFVLPSRHEPMGIVNLEAMACGLPVVASKVGGVPELVEEGQTGLLVPPDDAGALAEALERVLTDRALAERLGQAGRQRVEQFDWSRIVDQYLGVYEGVLKSVN